MSTAPQGRFRVSAVAEKTGLTAATIRGWERRYGVPKPSRSGNNYRLYEETDIAELESMKGHVERGVAPAEAAELVSAEKKTRQKKERADADE